MDLTYQIKDMTQGHVIALKGDCFRDGSDKTLYNKAREYVNNEEPNVIFDLSELRHLNSSGINVFVRMLRLVNENGGKLVFVHVPAHVTELLNIIKLNSIFNIENNLEDGIKCLSA